MLLRSQDIVVYHKTFLVGYRQNFNKMLYKKSCVNHFHVLIVSIKNGVKQELCRMEQVNDLWKCKNKNYADIIVFKISFLHSIDFVYDLHSTI